MMIGKDMKVLVRATMAVCLAAAVAGCSQEAKVSLETEIDKASYGIGLNMGRGLAKEEGVTFNGDAIAAGIQDILTAKEQRVTDEDIQAAIAAVRDIQMAKLQELNEAASKESTDFLAENAKRDGVTVTESGLQYEVLASGEGATPAETDVVSTHYHGTLIDGTVFDSSVERGQPAEFPVNRVIPGWTEALQKMKVGDKWKLFVPSDLAYGERSPSPKIPANATLIFEVELLSVKGLEKPEAQAAVEAPAAQIEEAVKTEEAAKS